MNNTDIEQLLRSLKEQRETLPTETFRTNARIRILNMVTNPHPLKLSWYQKPRVFGYAVGSMIATVLLSVGTVYAAQSSLPNSKLYPLKVLSEQVALTLSPTAQLRTTVASSIIARRIDEVQKAQKQGDQKEINASITNLDDDVAKLQKRKDISRDAIDSVLSKHQTFMSNLKHRSGKENKNNSEAPDANQTNTEPKPTITISGATPAPMTTTQPEIRLPQVEGSSDTRHKEEN